MAVRGLAGAFSGLVLAAGGLGACFLSLDGYAGPPETDAASPEVTTSGADASDRDAASSDAAADAPVPGPFCPIPAAAGTLLCEDFDGVNPGLPVTQPRSSLTLVSDPHVSPPSAMRVDVKPLTTASTVARIARNLEIVPKRIRFRADLKVESCVGSTNVFVFYFAIDADRTGAFAFQVRGDGFVVVNQIGYSNGTDDYATFAPVKRSWPSASFVHFELTWHDDFTADVIVDGVTIGTGVKLLSTWGKGKVSVEYGNAYSNGGGDCHFTVDNVLVDGE
jgi:hypothetical protein